MNKNNFSLHQQKVQEFAKSIDLAYATSLAKSMSRSLRCRFKLGKVTPEQILTLFKKVNTLPVVEGERDYYKKLYNLACEELTHHHLTEEEILLTAEDYDKKIKDKYSEIKRKEWGIDEE